MGIGVEEILEAVVKKVPPPADTREEPLRALIFDSYYDAYRGVIVYFRVVDGSLAAGDVVKLMATGKEYCVDEVGVLVPEKVPCARLQAGDVGYLAASIKAVADARVGDTITLKKRQAGEALPGYQEATPMVFCGLFPTDADAFADLREALGRLQLNDAALRYEPEVSPAMGFGFRCGFLGWVVFLLQVFSFQVFFPPGVEVRESSKGKSERRRRKKRQGKTNSLSLSLKKKKKKTSLLHMEIVQERLEREYDLDLITTAPTVAYRVKLPSAGRHAGGSAAAAAAAAVAANAPLPPSAASSGGATGEGVVKGASGASTASQLVVINNDAIDDPLLVAVDNPASVPVRSVSISGKLKEREKVGRTPPPKKKNQKTSTSTFSKNNHNTGCPRLHRGALRPHGDHHSKRLRRPAHGARPEPPRRVHRHALPDRGEDDVALRRALGRSRHRLFRRAQVAVARVRFDGVLCHWLPQERPGAAGRQDQRGGRGAAGGDRAQGQRVPDR